MEMKLKYADRYRSFNYFLIAHEHGLSSTPMRWINGYVVIEKNNKLHSKIIDKFVKPMPSKSLTFPVEGQIDYEDLQEKLIEIPVNLTFGRYGYSALSIFTGIYNDFSSNDVIIGFDTMGLFDNEATRKPEAIENNCKALIDSILHSFLEK